MEKKPLTREGFERLKQELERLKREELPAIAKELEIARSYGDLSENAEYKYAKERQEQVMFRIAQLEKLLSTCEVIEIKSMKVGEVVFGCWVKIKDLMDGKEGVYRIVGEMEADIKKGEISYVSPLGKALIGKKEGDVLSFNTPGGERKVQILKISVNGPEAI
jgi:transcription elongation factor GreA